MGYLKRLLLIILIFGCQNNDDRCGTIIQKVEINLSYYFVLQTDEYINYLSNPSQTNLPDDGVRQGKVSQEIYNNYEVGDIYCSQI